MVVVEQVQILLLQHKLVLQILVVEVVEEKDHLVKHRVVQVDLVLLLLDININKFVYFYSIWNIDC